MIATTPELIVITKAEYAGGYKVTLQFDDGLDRVVDFESFLSKATNPMTTKYREESLFRDFKVEHGDLVWGDYEMCFPIADLYEGDI